MSNYIAAHNRVAKKCMEGGDMDKYIIKNGVETDGDIDINVFWIEDKDTNEIVASSSYMSIASKIRDMLNNGELVANDEHERGENR